jgi:hypothetical protein
VTLLLLKLLGSLLVWGGIALRLGRVIGSKRFWLSQWVGNSFWAVWWAAQGRPGWAAYAGFAAAGGWWMWRHSNDDDDRWRRLLAWGRSKLPRPVIVRLRPALEGR